MTVLSGRYGSFILATNSVFSTAAANIYMVPHGIGNTLVTFVSNYIGANKPNGTMYYLKMSYCVYFNYLILLELALFFFFDSAMGVFTNQQDVIKYIYTFKHFFMIFFVLDGL